jgi:hypothetical protein
MRLCRTVSSPGDLSFGGDTSPERRPRPGAKQAPTAQQHNTQNNWHSGNEGAHVLELTMATVSAADAGATAGMQMADAPSEPGAMLRVGRDRGVCRLATPDDWLFVSRVHLEFLCGPEGAWQVTWLRGSHDDPSSEVRLVLVGGAAPQTLPYGGTAKLPLGGSGELIIYDRTGPRSVNVGFYHEV